MHMPIFFADCHYHEFSLGFQVDGYADKGRSVWVPTVLVILN